jgi:hypothetical protein
MSDLLLLYLSMNGTYDTTLEFVYIFIFKVTEVV